MPKFINNLDKPVDKNPTVLLGLLDIVNNNFIYSKNNPYYLKEIDTVELIIKNYLDSGKDIMICTVGDDKLIYVGQYNDGCL